MSGSALAPSATIFSASVSATEIFGSSAFMIPASNVEDLAVARLDLLALLLNRRGVVLHGLDVLERLAAGLVLRVRVHRAQAADINDQLLGLAAERERLEQLCRIRIGRGL